MCLHTFVSWLNRKGKYCKVLTSVALLQSALVKHFPTSFLYKEKIKNHTLLMLFHRRLHLVLNGVLSHKVISHLIIWCCFLSVSSWRLWVPHSAVRRPDVVWFLPWLPLKFMRRTVLPEKESQTWRSRAGWTASDWARSRGARTGDGSPCWTRPRSSSGPATWRAKASSPAQIWGLENKFCVCVVEMCVRLKWDGVVTSKSPVCKLSELWTVQVYQEQFWWWDFKAATQDYFLKE